MEAWTLQLSVGELLIDFSIVGGLLVVAAILRRFIRPLREYLVPCSLIAGFLGLILGAEATDLLPIEADRMGAYVYHLLALTFIGVGLYRTERKVTYGVVNLGFMQICIMLLQGLVGLGIAIAVMHFLIPELNPATGMLLPLGFAMGPGIAYSIGQSWTAFGVEGAGSMGLTIAAIGFLVAYGWGMTMVGRRERAPGSITDADQNAAAQSDDELRVPRARSSDLDIRAIEPLAVLTGLIGGLYFLTWLLVSGLAGLLMDAGLEQEIPILWSFHFIIANLVALFTRHVVLRRMGAQWIDDHLLAHITGTLAEYLVATSIMAISLTVAWHFAFPIVLTTAAGALLTWWVLSRLTRVLFKRYRFERFIGIFGQMTGTISSGLALLRVSDPGFRTPVAQELVLSSGMALALGFPLLILINLPFTAFDGVFRGFLIVWGLMAAYLVLLAAAWAVYLRRYSNDR